MDHVDHLDVLMCFLSAAPEQISEEQKQKRLGRAARFGTTVLVDKDKIDDRRKKFGFGKSAPIPLGHEPRKEPPSGVEVRAEVRSSLFVPPPPPFSQEARRRCHSWTFLIRRFDCRLCMCTGWTICQQTISNTCFPTTALRTLSGSICLL